MIFPGLGRALAEPLGTQTPRQQGSKDSLLLFHNPDSLGERRLVQILFIRAAPQLLTSILAYLAVKMAVPATEGGTYHFKAGERSLAQVPLQSEF